MGQRKQGRGSHGRFLGFWARLNCENMPVIPAWLVRRCLDDPHKIPYLLIWKDEIHDGRIMEAVRLSRYLGDDNCVEIKRTDGDYTVLRTVCRMLPRNGGWALFLLCPCCETPRRQVYGWQWDSVSGWSNRVRSVSWRCRSCARLRYSSEGGYLSPGKLFRALGNLPRPDAELLKVGETFNGNPEPSLKRCFGKV